MKWKVRALYLRLLIPVFLTVQSAFCQGTAFTYQGRLNDNGGPANGSYDFQFALFDAVTGGNQITPAVTNAAVSVSNGLFTTTIDFGSVFTGSNYWLDIEVGTNGATNFADLSPRQSITPAPYAIYSANAGAATSANSVAGSNIVGAIATGQLPSGLLTNGEAAVNLTGSFSGNGSQLTNIAATTLVTNLLNTTNGLAVNVSTNSYESHGTYTFTIPASINQIVVKLWGAGGGISIDADGGGGGFSQVTLNVTPGDAYVLVVGQHGEYGSVEGGGGAGGGAGSNNSSGGAGNLDCGGGGQASSLFKFAAPDYIMKAVAGGGGGGGFNYGGSAGQGDGSGAGYAANATTIGETNLDLMGGAGAAGEVGDGGQGGGYGAGTAKSDGQSGGGGSYGDITISGSLNTPGNTADPNYVSGTADSDQDGLGIVIFINRGPVATLDETVQATSFVGDVPDSDLSTNVALRSGGNAFTGNQSVTSGYLGIGTNNPAAALYVASAAYETAVMTSPSASGTWLTLGNSSTGGTNWQILSTGSGNGQGAGKLVFDTGIFGSTTANVMQLSSAGVTVYGTFNNNSDRNAKQDFSAVTPSQILDKVARLPVSEWSYKTDAETRHIGPMAQDFYSAFSIGTDDKHIAPIDEGGVALAAIQGLNQKLEEQAKEKDAEIEQLKAKGAKFAEELKTKDEKVDQLEEQLNKLQDSLEKLGVLK